MQWTESYGETTLVFDGLTEVFEAHRSCLEVHGVNHPATKQLIGIMEAVHVMGVPFERLADIDYEAATWVIGALSNCVAKDPWRQDQGNMMLAGLSKPALVMAA